MDRLIPLFLVEVVAPDTLLTLQMELFNYFLMRHENCPAVLICEVSGMDHVNLFARRVHIRPTNPAIP